MISNASKIVARTLQVAAIATTACCVPRLTHAQAHAHRVTLDAGTVITVRLDDPLSSNESRAGDKFTATVKTEGSAGQNRLWALPPGSKIEGVVRMARRKKDKSPGALDLTFERLILPDNSSYRMHGSLIGLDNKSVSRDRDGRLVANKAHRTDRLTYVGYGAGGGLLIGLIASKKNAVQDTAIGAGLGYLYGALQKHHSDARDVSLKEGTQLGVRLDSRLTYARPVGRS